MKMRKKFTCEHKRREISEGYVLKATPLKSSLGPLKPIKINPRKVMRVANSTTLIADEPIEPIETKKIHIVKDAWQKARYNL